MDVKFWYQISDVRCRYGPTNHVHEIRDLIGCIVTFIFSLVAPLIHRLMN